MGRKPNGYWKDRERVKERLGPLIGSLGKFPTQTEIIEYDSALMKGIQNHHGGVRGVKRWYGLESAARPHGYWTKETIRNELENIVEELGMFPTVKEIREIDGGLMGAIQKKGGGITHFWKEYGVSRRPPGYWQDLSNVMKEIEVAMEEFGHFPKQRELETVNSGLSNAIVSYHGGFNRMRKLFGVKAARRPNGYLRDIEKVMEELEPVIEALGRFPYYREIQVRDSGLVSAIVKYHGGMSAVKMKLGYANEELEVLRQIVEETADDK